MSYFQKVTFHTIDHNHFNQRLDNYLVLMLKGVPKTHIYRIIRKGEVRINKKRTKPSAKLQIGDIIRIPPLELKISPKKSILKNIAQCVESSIIYEDEYILALNKPNGIAVHRGSGIHSGVIEILKHLRPKCSNMELVHRLDRDTSGCLVIAKKRSMLRHLHCEFREGRVVKKYQALVLGKWPKRKNLIDLPLKKQIIKSGERMVQVSSDGKPSKTWFYVYKYYEKFSLLDINLDTGRTHQIRVHASSSGYPVAGESKYASKEQIKLFKEFGIKSLMLHACQLSFVNIDGQHIQLNAPPPHAFELIDKRLS